MSVTDKRKTFCVAMVDCAIKRFKIDQAPSVLYWNSWVAETCQATGISEPDWVSRTTEQARNHLRQHKPHLRRILDEHRILALTCNAYIKKYFKHGEPPTLDVKCRTPTFYATCVPSATNPAMGFVLFPVYKDMDAGHPFLVEWFKRSGKSAGSRFSNCLASMDDARLRGLLTTAQLERLVQDPRQQARNAISRIDRPLLE